MRAAILPKPLPSGRFAGEGAEAEGRVVFPLIMHQRVRDVMIENVQYVR
jgi:hypothetical protein